MPSVLFQVDRSGTPATHPRAGCPPTHPRCGTPAVTVMSRPVLAMVVAVLAAVERDRAEPDTTTTRSTFEVAVVSEIPAPVADEVPAGR